MNRNSIWVVIPAYNESQVISGVLKELSAYHPPNRTVVVDDDSTDNSAAMIRHSGVHLLYHSVNLGQGAALATGIKYAMQLGADIIVTFDADGQMDPSDISKLVDVVTTENIDVALGSRFLASRPEGIPTLKLTVLKLATVFTRMTTGLQLSDTHNGMRALKTSALKQFEITQNRMAHSSEILTEIAKKKLAYKEVPVTIRYTPYSKAKGQSLLNAINILYELFTGGF